MALITISHNSGENIKVSFDKEQLKLISKVANHPTLSNESNWKMVSVIYKHNSSNKRIAAGFKNNFTKIEDIKIKSGMSGGQTYTLEKILISGNNRVPILVIKNTDIANVSSFNLTLSGASGGLYGPLVWNTVYGPDNNLSLYIMEPDGGLSQGGQGYITTTNCPGPYEEGEFTFSVYGYGTSGFYIGIRGADVGRGNFIGLCSIGSWGSKGNIQVTKNETFLGQVLPPLWSYESNTVTIKRETNNQGVLDVSINVNGTEVYRQADEYPDQPFRPVTNASMYNWYEQNVFSATRNQVVVNTPVTLSSVSAQQPFDAPITVSAVFGSAVTNFTAGDVSVTNGTVVSVTGSGTSYSINISPNSQSNYISVSVPNGSVSKSDGGTNRTSNTLTIYALRNVATYRYVKMSAKESWNGGYYAGISDVTFRWDNSTQNISSYASVDYLNNPLSYGAGNIINNNIEIVNASDLKAWAFNGSFVDLFVIDLKDAKALEAILIGPQAGYNYPKTFKIYGSVDNSTWTEITSVEQTSNSSWSVGNYNRFDFS